MKIKNYILLIILASFLFSFFAVLLNYYYKNYQTMAESVWGQLAKSQTDDETIEEAVARLIAEHETNAGAHTGAGEALETHKTQEVIDHPALSVVSDKQASYTTDNLLFREDGRGSAGWWLGSSGPSSEIDMSLFYTYAYLEDPSPARADGSGFLGGYRITYATDDFRFEFPADFSLGGGVDTWVSMGKGPLYAVGNAAGFRYKKSDGHIYAFNRISAAYTETDLGAPPVDEYQLYKITYANNEFKFYINDVLVATHTTNIPTGYDTPNITFGCIADPTGSGKIEIRYFEFYLSSAMYIN